LPSSLTTIGQGAFQGCSGLTSIDFILTHPGITNLGTYVFAICTGLTVID